MKVFTDTACLQVACLQLLGVNEKVETRDDCNVACPVILPYKDAGRTDLRST
jgi:hypothetical protein